MFLFYLTVRLLYNNEKEKYTNKKGNSNKKC
jgi:hypothetical protein